MPRRLTTSSFRTRTPPAATAPMPNSGWPGAPSLRETNTSSGALRAREISYPTGTPPLGRAKTTGRSSSKRASFPASRRPASLRSSKGGKPKILMASAQTPPERRQGLAALLDVPHPARILPAGGFSLDPLHRRGDALGQGAEVVASFQDERRGRGPDFAGEIRDQGGEASERGATQCHAPQQVVCVGVESCGDQGHPGPELPQHGQEDPAESTSIEVLAGTSRQRHVDREARPFSSPHFTCFTSPWIEGTLMHREVEDAGVPVEDVLGAVAVVHIPVQDGDLLQPLREGVSGCDGRVVREAEPHPVVPPRVVARRTGDGEGRLTGEGALDRRAGGPAREGGSLPGTRADRGIRAEVALSRRGHLSQVFQVSEVVDSGEGFSLRGPARAPLYVYPAVFGPFDPGEGRREPLRRFHGGEVVYVALRGRITVDVQTLHAPRSLLRHCVLSGP